MSPYISLYLDDYLLVHRGNYTYFSSCSNAEIVSKLGVVSVEVNYKKFVLKLSQEIEYLGLVLNSQQNKIKHS